MHTVNSAQTMKQAKPPARQHTGQLLCSGRGIGFDLDPARRRGKKEVSVLMFAGQAQLFLYGRDNTFNHDSVFQNCGVLLGSLMLKVIQAS